MSSTARPFYYLDHFREALAWLRDRYTDVLAPEEIEFIETMRELPQPTAGLLVRLIMRRGDLFRTGKIQYAEIGPTEGLLPVLAELTWLNLRPSLSLRQLCTLLRRDELQKAFHLRRMPRALKSHHTQLELALDDTETRPLREWWHEAPDEILQVRIARLCKRLRLMFFGSFHQDWSAFVLTDLGLRRYETVTLDRSSRAFQTREQVEQFESLYDLREKFREGATAAQLLAHIPPPLPGCDWIEGRRARLLFKIGQRAEKARDRACAMKVYGACELPEARVRAIRVLERADQVSTAMERLEELDYARASEMERQHAVRIRPRLMRRLGLAAATSRCALNPTWKTFDLELPSPEAKYSVERLVRDQLGRVESPVVYVENALINTLFGLLFWDAIFAPIPGAFFHPFQAAPIDLFDTGFQARRHSLIQACLTQLEVGTYRETITANFARKAGLSAPFVAWGRVTRESIQWALDCVPAAHLRALFTRLIEDLRTNRTGLPDLIQFWPAERRYRMIEVKGPGDRLQDNQIRWLRFCAERDIPVELCRVRWANEPSPQQATPQCDARSTAFSDR